jgi:hypothetical protein
MFDEAKSENENADILHDFAFGPTGRRQGKSGKQISESSAHFNWYDIFERIGD